MVVMNCLLVIFGGTGDLANRKLYPAIYNLYVSGNLPDGFAVVSVGRKEKSNETFRSETEQSIKKFSRPNSDGFKSLQNVLSRFFYFSLNFYDEIGYLNLKSFLHELDAAYSIPGNRIYYMAVSPENFLPIVDGLHKAGMAAPDEEPISRVVVEKPFGSDYDSSFKLNGILRSVFGERDIYRIDHYLGKEMLQNIMAIRFANSVFEPLWDKRYIDHVQITSSETVGIENRGAYYEKSGAIRDMMQNHMLQLLMLTAMDAPLRIDAQSVRNEKLKVLKAIRPINKDSAEKLVVRGQYAEGFLADKKLLAYRQETGVNPESNTDTYVAMRLDIDSNRWDNVPFYLRTGKRMPYKTTEIAVVFKRAAMPEGLEINSAIIANTLIIKVQPQEAAVIWLNGKKPGTINEIVPISMGFCQNCSVGEVSPDAYERLLHDVLRGDTTLFASWDEVELSWKFIDGIIESWNDRIPDFPNYAAGTWGPAAADELLARDGRQWNEYIWRCFNYEVIRCVNADT
jgi:glucose-6-phosphate 1-dehydrogenase